MHAMKALYMINFSIMEYSLENTAVLEKAIFCDLHDLKLRNYKPKKIDILDKIFQQFLKMMKQNCYRIPITLYNHHLTIQMLTKVFTAYIKVFEDTWDFIIHTLEDLKIFCQHWTFYQIQG